MNKFMNALTANANYTTTENGAVAVKSCGDALCDLFGRGAAYRDRSDEDCILLFKKAFDEEPELAMKCLFYLYDVRGGTGERRFFKVVAKWLAMNHTEAIKRNLTYIPEYGRWDAYYIFIGTPLQDNALRIMKHQLALDVKSYQAGKAISLLAKWLPSENASSTESKKLAAITRHAFGMTAKQYRKTLSTLREHLKVLERLMSENRWGEISFDAIPSKAGFKYRNAFAKHDLERMKQNKEATSYKDFVQDKNTKVNAKVLYPYEVVAEAVNVMNSNSYGWPPRKCTLDDTNRLAINKYWDNLKDYFNGCSLNALMVVDTSGSMWVNNADAPINVAISLGMYCAERNKGPWAGKYISFSRNPRLVEVEGIDFCDKVDRIYKTNLCENTDIERTFDMLLNTAIASKCTQADLPSTVLIVSDMEFDAARGSYYSHGSDSSTLMENISRKWKRNGYKMPNLVFWNVRSHQDNMPMKMKDGITFVSGMSPVIFEMVMKGKTAKDLVLDKLNSERYAVIH